MAAYEWLRNFNFSKVKNGPVPAGYDWITGPLRYFDPITPIVLATMLARWHTIASAKANYGAAVLHRPGFVLIYVQGTVETFPTKQVFPGMIRTVWPLFLVEIVRTDNSMLYFLTLICKCRHISCTRPRSRRRAIRRGQPSLH